MLDSIVGVKTDRGFTLHEHLDEIGVIHMNARVYDPLIGRFMSADSIIPNPFDMKAFNRYSYGYNNPLAGINTSHYAARLEQVGLNVAKVESIVAGQVNAIRQDIGAIGADFWGRFHVGGVLVAFRARLAENGLVNIGTLFPVK